MTVPFPSAPEVLVSTGSADDAGVYRLAPDLALVQTLDFFTPIIDDPITWGRIAATNALSDVYAMGGRPITAMNIVAWPRDTLPWAILGQVLDGAAEVLADAGCVLVGGHSIDDVEPKFGLSVTGVVDPNRMLTNAAGQAGDVLVLTKPLGVGILTTAVKLGLAGIETEAVAVRWMTASNRLAAETAVTVGASCATDVTGFGLIGHLAEIVRASGVSAELDLAAVPVLDGVRDLIAAGAVPGGTRRNLDDASMVVWGDAEDADRLVLCDAQTSGGMLLAMPAASARTFEEILGADRVWIIGGLIERSGQDRQGPHEPRIAIV